MKFNSVKKIKVTEQIAEQIRKSIIKGLYKPGDKLPPERELAKLFNVTRTTLREALKKLEGLKLVFIRQGDGVTVGDYLKSESLDLLSDLLFSEDKVDGQILLNILEARKIFAVAMLNLALEKYTDKQREKYTSLFEDLKNSKHDIQKIQILDFECFNIITEASNNIVFIFILNSIKGLYLQYKDFFLSLYDDPDEIINTHKTILSAMNGGSKKKAISVMEKYLNRPILKLKENFLL